MCDVSLADGDQLFERAYRHLHVLTFLVETNRRDQLHPVCQVTVYETNYLLAHAHVTAVLLVSVPLVKVCLDYVGIHFEPVVPNVGVKPLDKGFEPVLVVFTCLISLF